MAKNPPPGKGRVGAVTKRDQVWNPKTKRWTKRGPKKKFMDQYSKKGKPFKGIRKRRS